jgi:SAM-dependent methyltransferase
MRGQLDAQGAEYYDRTALWWGTTQVTARDRHRAACVDRIPGGPHRVLELGAGYGGSAAATADLGHTVVAVERSSRRAWLARRHEQRRRDGDLTILEADFLTISLTGTFDVIVYWSGFGAGDDSCHELLLTRIHDWLAPGGLGLIDVFNPAWWAAADAEERPMAGLRRRLGFEPVSKRFTVTCWPEGRPDAVSVESVRCYSPGEVAALLSRAALVPLNAASWPEQGEGATYLVVVTR